MAPSPGARPADVQGVGVAVGQPAGRGVADREPGVLPRHLGELGRVRGVGQHVADRAALHPVGQLSPAERGGGGQDHRAELHHAEHGLPQLDLVVQHQQHVVAAGDTMPGQERRHLIGPAGQLVEGVPGLRPILLDDPQGGADVTAGVRVEPVDGPVETVTEVGPGERLDGLRVVPAQFLQQVACLPVDLGPAGGPGWFDPHPDQLLPCWLGRMTRLGPSHPAGTVTGIVSSIAA